MVDEVLFENNQSLPDCDEIKLFNLHLCAITQPNGQLINR